MLMFHCLYPLQIQQPTSNSIHHDRHHHDFWSAHAWNCLSSFLMSKLRRSHPQSLQSPAFLAIPWASLSSALLMALFRRYIPCLRLNPTDPQNDNEWQNTTESCSSQSCTSSVESRSKAKHQTIFWTNTGPLSILDVAGYWSCVWSWQHSACPL